MYIHFLAVDEGKCIYMCSNLHFHQQYLRFHIFPYFRLHLILSHFVFAFLVDEMVVYYDFNFHHHVLTDDRVFYFAKCLFKSLAKFSTGLLLLFVLI